MKLGFLTILGLIFITLKLTGHITWSWIWVLMPLWILPAVYGLGIIFILLVAFLKTLIKK